MNDELYLEDKMYFDLQKKRSDLGILDSKYQLAILFERGQGTEIDTEQAFMLMYEVAQNNEEWERRVGGYRNGTYWDGYKTVKGVPEAKYRLAYYYENGIGTEVDLKKALEWYSLALEFGYNDAEKDVERLKKL